MKKTKQPLVIAHLEVKDWNGFGGIHFNGTVKWDGEMHRPRSFSDYETTRHEHELEYVMTTADAKKMNRLDRGDFKYKKGDETNRYFEIDRVIEDAIEFAKNTECIGLLKRGSGFQPMPVLFCRLEEYRERLEKLGAEFDRMYEDSPTGDPWTTFPKRSRKVIEEWDSLVKQAGFLNSLRDVQKRSSKKRRKKK